MKEDGRNGAILIITLWILTILTALSVGIATRMGLELKLAGLQRDNMKAFYLAKAGIERAIAVIEKEDHGVDGLKERWSNNSEDEKPLFKEVEVGGAGTFTVSYRFSEESVFYGFQDEERRININSAPRRALKNLIKYLIPETSDEDADELAALIEDWRDADSSREGATPEYGYSEEGYTRKDALFDAVEEVLLIKGMTAELFEKIKDYITVYPVNTTGKLNVNTASLPPLVALGLPPEVCAVLIARRAGDDGIEGTGDDVLFEQGAFNTFLNDQKPILSPEDITLIMNLVTFGSQHFRITSCGRTAHSGAAKTVTCVVGPHPTLSKFQILLWDER